MTEFDFADRYAEAGIAPKAELIDGRRRVVDRIADSMTKEQTFDLVSLYFDTFPLDLSWFRDEFRKEDAAFSVMHNKRECVILAALILAKKVTATDGIVILAVVTAWMHGKRTPTEAGWLLDQARSTLRTHAARGRRPSNVTTDIKVVINAKLTDELAAVPPTDINAILQAVGKVRAETHAAAANLATQIIAALVALNQNAEFLREESQILWWLFAAHSRSLDRPFNAIRTAQGAIIAGIELGELSVASSLGPVAAPAVLDRILDLTKKDRAAQQAPSISAVIDGIGAADLAALPNLDGLRTPPVKYPFVFPLLTAVGKAREVGIGSWSNTFQKATGLDPTISLAPTELALQTYHERLLGQL